MSQIALPFAWPAVEDERDFCRGEANIQVLRHLEHRALWPVMATLITGPRKSGRSLLGRIFAAKTGGRLIDDADRRPEEELFHAWNRAQAERLPLLLIADAPPPMWQIALPDLRSRIAATPHVAITEPDDGLAATLMERLLGQRGLAAGPDVIAYLLPRIERSYVAILRVVDALDQLSLERRSRITVPLAREALRLVGVIDDS
ncbi:DNA replication initiation ATPase [Sphingomonas sp. MM-1]|uniref:HdaA/DnaA family protein n=1 Tax=Sphingomonas sp. MM-1 TaxID=745310 RepID=UPI0002C10883|nr:DNA replication initiation ATPase [Sphingomonas sp. MM-1]AGH51313.1 DNA replication initiation ATPase [Sphingomonas sp. MM-1]